MTAAIRQRLMTKRNIFVTTALPYANGPFHIGHITEYILADIWVRHERMAGNQVYFVGADDTHGAQKKGVTPQEFVAEIRAGRKQYLDGFHVKFDWWHTTDSPENVELSQDIYRRLKAAGLIYSKEITQYYDTQKGMFLADRFIKGKCPHCGAEDQYGDSCEVCGSVYRPTELINPYSVLSGTKPELRSSTHYFFKLSDPKAVQFLRDWTSGNGADGKPRVQPEVLAKDQEWLGEGAELEDWDISRDAPYFGIPIPDAPGKYFYVWLDAPVGYLASLKSYFNSIGKNFDEFLMDPKTEQIHFIGKDIIYFHTLFWPAMLHFAGKPYRVPDHIYAHGFVTVGGLKMSKSRGNVVNPDDYIKEYGADAFRMYIMFMGAFDQPIPWNTQGTKGCRKFLERVWRLQDMISDAQGVRDSVKASYHATIKKVSEDIERMKFNTAIAAIMSFVNDIYATGSITRDELRTLLILLFPFAPHIAEEINEAAKLGSPIYEARWPEYDESALVADSVEIGVQINGKVRARIMVPANAAKEEIEKLALESADVKPFTEGKTVRKVIVVKNIVNIVVA